MTNTRSSTNPATRKAVVEKDWTLDDIFSHPDFRVLYVPPSNEENMTIITPSKYESASLHHQGFYALSHLWGKEPKKHMWDVSDFITDEKNIPVEPIPMRPEKRKTLLSLLRANPGYWWIDVLCCRSDTPPVIMAGVYGCCKKCFAMIDCPTPAIEYLSVTFDFDHLHQLFYPQEHCVDPTKRMEYLKNAFLNAYDVHDSCWFTRVWTLQEATLPLYVTLLSETCGSYAESKTIRLTALYLRYRQFLKYAQLLEVDIYSELPRSPSGNSRSPDDFMSLLSLNRCIREVRNSIHYALTDSMRLLAFTRIFVGLSQSQRSCYSAVDYVHGVSGILSWDIPRLDHPDDVWAQFILYLQSFAETLHGDLPKHNQENMEITVSDKAQSFSLSGAKELGEVYRGLLQMKLHCTCTTCAAFKKMLSFDDK